MPRLCQGSVVCLLLLIPLSAFAISPLYDWDAVVTLRNGKPCFSYPPNKEKLFGYHLVVSTLAPHGAVVWEIQRYDYENTKLPEPDRAEACIEYGVINSEIEEKRAAEPLRVDTPYQVFISVAEAPTGGHRYRYLRKVGHEFCISRNEKGEPILVGASGSGTGEWRCLKPGGSPKRGFWQRLFGK